MKEEENKNIENNEEKENKNENIFNSAKKSLNKNKRNFLLRKGKVSSAKLTFNKSSKEYLTEKTNLPNFAGFYNLKFNLDLYRQIKNNIRLQLKSPKKPPKQNQRRGNGIPNNIFERLNFLGKKFNDQKFINYYNKKPEKKAYNLDEIVNYLIKYSKVNTELDSVMMAFYFICKEIKFDRDCYDNNRETKNNQSPINVYDEGLAVSSGFTNLFEYILKKMKIKFRHIDGYCKLMPKKEGNKKLKNKKINRVQSAKNYNETINELNETINHSWNAIYIQNEWYFCDCLFGSGSIEQDEDLITQINLKQLDINNNIYNYNSSMTNGTNTKNNEIPDSFNFFYFMIPPELFISTHRPLDDTWQFIPKTLSFKEFYSKRLINYGEFYKNVYKYNVKLISHKEPFISITTKEKLKIKIKVPNHLIEANLFFSLGNTKISEVKYAYNESNDVYTLEPFFPQKGEYTLKINARSLTSTDLLYWPLLDYIIKIDTFFQTNPYMDYETQRETKIKNKGKIEPILPKLNKSSSLKIFTPKIIQDYSKIFPPKNFKKICYDNENFKLIEPRSNLLRIGTVSRFKVVAKGALSVSILDGNKMTFLKKHEDNLFIGEREIETNNVSLCCHKGKNVFTEMHKFRVLVQSRVLSAKPLLKRKKKIFK